eukprot:366343-Chlamydomonas_euryale.AAC.9
MVSKQGCCVNPLAGHPGRQRTQARGEQQRAGVPSALGWWGLEPSPLESDSDRGLSAADGNTAEVTLAVALAGASENRLLRLCEDDRVRSRAIRADDWRPARHGSERLNLGFRDMPSGLGLDSGQVGLQRMGPGVLARPGLYLVAVAVAVHAVRTASGGVA